MLLNLLILASVTGMPIDDDSNQQDVIKIATENQIEDLFNETEKLSCIDTDEDNNNLVSTDIDPEIKGCVQVEEQFC